MSFAQAGYSLLIIFTIAALTFGARVLPFAVFSRGGKAPGIIAYIGDILPPAVMIMLVVYCLRNTELAARPYGIPEAVSVAAVVILYKLTKNNLVAMVCGTLLYMVLVQAVFPA